LLPEEIEHHADISGLPFNFLLLSCNIHELSRMEETVDAAMI
jgi:hypothetical protein